ncbi:cell division inhibitor SepF [Jatrophihabitans sp. GAS493]|uniref:cell division protein SepF n=1 Tax=Jatrophihabitans sp. GAS493 TaxID=1907575 RepID=UPI000BB938CD|nr:cell division inhibitor SepF [Jatrophihabitans sp. GAS493]
MPGAMRKMGVYLGLVEDEDEFVGEAAESYPRAAGRGVERTVAAPQYARAGAGYAREVETSGAPAAGHAAWDEIDAVDFAELDAPSYRITTLHPRTYNEARTIGEHYRAGTPVIVNLSEMDDADAKRLVDFSAGLTFGLHGRLERVTAKVFLLSPNNVTVTAQDKQRIVEGGFFNQS